MTALYTLNARDKTLIHWMYSEQANVDPLAFREAIQGAIKSSKSARIEAGNTRRPKIGARSKPRWPTASEDRALTLAAAAGSPIDAERVSVVILHFELKRYFPRDEIKLRVMTSIVRSEVEECPQRCPTSGLASRYDRADAHLP